MYSSAEKIRKTDSDSDSEDENMEKENKLGEEICEKLGALLIPKSWKGEQEIEFPQNDFCLDTSVDCLPRMVIDGQWEVKFPCDEEISKKLIAYASPAPVGKGTETVMDKEIRNGWHIDASKVTFLGEKWEKMFSDSKNSALLETIRKVLAPDCKEISANFHKLLIYEKGSFFKLHRDTQRQDNHFGTIVVFLPCSYSGGEFSIQHCGETRKFSFSLKPNCDDDTFKANVIAFFADCLHEVLPVTEGYRVNLTYELFFEGKRSPNPPERLTSIEQEIAESLSKLVELGKWKGRKLGIVLQHRYALASLKPWFLKGADHVMYNAVMATDRFDVELIPVAVHLDGAIRDNESEHDAETCYGECLGEREPMNFRIRRHNPQKPFKPWCRWTYLLKDYDSESDDEDDDEDDKYSVDKIFKELLGKEDKKELSTFTLDGDGDVQNVKGPVAFINRWRRQTIGSVLLSDTQMTGNDGTA